MSLNVIVVYYSRELLLPLLPLVSYIYRMANLSMYITALLAGGLGYLVVEILDRRLHAQFIPEFLGSLVIGIISVLGHYLLPTGDLATIIIASVMPIVPGVLITNAIQDLFGGHMLMFTTKSLGSTRHCFWYWRWRWFSFNLSLGVGMNVLDIKLNF